MGRGNSGEMLKYTSQRKFTTSPQNKSEWLWQKGGRSFSALQDHPPFQKIIPHKLLLQLIWTHQALLLAHRKLLRRPYFYKCYTLWGPRDESRFLSRESVDLQDCNYGCGDQGNAHTLNMRNAEIPFAVYLLYPSFPLILGSSRTPQTNWELCCLPEVSFSLKMAARGLGSLTMVTIIHIFAFQPLATLTEQ